MTDHSYSNTFRAVALTMLATLIAIVGWSYYSAAQVPAAVERATIVLLDHNDQPKEIFSGTVRLSPAHSVKANTDSKLVRVR